MRKTDPDCHLGRVRASEKGFLPDEAVASFGDDADGFVARLKLVKRFRLAWFGEDILDAIRNAPALGKKAPQLLIEDEPENGNEVAR